MNKDEKVLEIIEQLLKEELIKPGNILVEYYLPAEIWVEIGKLAKKGYNNEQT